MKTEKFKTFISGFFTAILVLSLSSPAIANPIRENVQITYNNIKIIIDGIKINPKDSKGEPVQPFIYKGTTYLPVRAVAEALGKNVDWDAQTNTVYLGEKPKQVYNSVRAEDFIKIHKPYHGTAPTVHGPETLQIGQQDVQVFNKVHPDNSTYLINGNYTKIKGLLIEPDDSSMYVSRVPSSFSVKGDGKELFHVRDYLKEVTGKAYIERGDKNQPIEFEINVTGVEELQLLSSGGYIYNLEFIAYDQ